MNKYVLGRPGWFTILAVVVLSGIALIAVFPPDLEDAYDDPPIAQTFLIVVAIGGVGAMILLQTAKQLFPLRGWFARRATAMWFEWRARFVAKDVDVPFAHVDPHAALKQIARALAVGFPQDMKASSTGDRGVQVLPAFLRVSLRSSAFDLPIEQFVGQLSSACDAALRSPGNYRDLLMILMARLDGSECRRLWHGVLAHGSKPASSDTPSHPSEAAVAEMEAEILASLDQLQIFLTGAWRYGLRVTASVLAVLLATVAMWYVDVHAYTRVAILVGAFVFGGWVASFARDLSALVEKARR